MKKIKTLKMNYEFKNVLEKGRYFVNSQIIIYILENKLDYNRIGIAISSKLCKAVKRNHLKRLIRESFKNFKEELKKPYDIVIIWNKRSDINSASYKEITNNMMSAFTKAGILYEKSND